MSTHYKRIVREGKAQKRQSPRAALLNALCRGSLMASSALRDLVSISSYTLNSFWSVRMSIDGLRGSTHWWDGNCHAGHGPAEAGKSRQPPDRTDLFPALSHALRNLLLYLYGSIPFATAQKPR